jgi:hypothetical protein
MTYGVTQHLHTEPADALDAYDGLPQLIVEMARVAGLDAALKIAAERGGNRIYVPATADDGHWLVQLVGRASADLLMGHFSHLSNADRADGGRAAGTELDMPLGPVGSRADMWRRLYRMIDDGCSSTEITRTLRISRDMVKYHRAKRREAHGSNQLSLLDLIDGDG